MVLKDAAICILTIKIFVSKSNVSLMRIVMNSMFTT